MEILSLKESCIRGWYLAKNVSLNTTISKNKIIIKRLVSTAFPVNLKSSLSFGNLRCEQIGNRLNFYNKHGTNMHDIRSLIIMSKYHFDIWKNKYHWEKNRDISNKWYLLILSYFWFQCTHNMFDRPWIENNKKVRLMLNGVYTCVSKYMCVSVGILIYSYFM